MVEIIFIAKMMLRFLLLTSLLENMVESQFNLYDAYQTVNNDPLQSDCLRVYERERRFSFFNFEYIFSTTTQYCLRPIDVKNLSTSDTLSRHDRNLTFKELYHLNVTIDQLLLWSAPVELAEQYQDYLNQPITSSASSEIFFNCTKPWFGSRCQYSFVLQEMLTPYDVFKATFEAKLNYVDPHKVTNLTCYIHLQCDRGGPSMCLDWREICDGRIDCLDGGLDEAHCFDLEVNECGENEFRCYNGICIGEDFFNSGDQSVICPNQPLSPFVDSDLDSCISNPSSKCEDSSCTSNKPFPCGDGQCVDDFNACRNGRHNLLVQSMSAQGNLSYDCWVAMACLTKIIDRIDEIPCENFSASSDLIAYIQSCEPLTQFPIIPVLFGHVRFFYNTTAPRQLDMKLSLPPDYICYNEQLCDFLIPTFRNGSHTCRYGYEMGFEQSMKYNNWSSIIHSIKRYFLGCLTGYENKTDLLHPSLYYCKNSSKRISKHRIIDGFSDCYMNDDEEQFNLSCLVNDTHRFQCHKNDKCRSPVFSRDTCSTNSQHNLEDILFQEVCNHVVQLLPDSQNHTDETECQDWPCNTIYKRCDSFRDCPNGDDEENCTASIRNLASLLCVYPHDYMVTCLSVDRVGDRIVDCFGASDEPDLCTNTDLYPQSSHRFQCWNTTVCKSLSSLCNGSIDCPFGDDEAFCGVLLDIFKENQLIYRNSVGYALCRLGRIDKMYFSLKTSSIYPLLSESKIIDYTDKQPRVHNIIASDDKFEHVDSAWAWRCNRGLYARFSLASSNDSYKCFCPPTYYGDWCQYQNQRVFLKLGLSLSDRHGVYAIVATLIDDDEHQEVNSYQQFVTVGGQLCGEFFDIYLLHSSRTKNESKNYSVRIDAFDKASLEYMASWYLNIPFPFLPVSYLAVVLNVPSHRAPKPNNCSLQCNKGECVKYTNGNNFFCHCQTGWSGAQCQIPVNCSDCSSDSLCVGHMNSRPICVCPLTKFGPRCLLTHPCPENFCHNNGRCIMINPSFNDQGYACICSEQFGGLRCEYRKAKVEIHFNNMEIPSYLFVHIITVNDSQLPAQKVMFKKFLMFQHSVTLYILDDFHIVFVKIGSSYYLAVLQQFKQPLISTSISPAQRCRPINELLNSTIMTWPKIRQVKYYHIPCQMQFDLLCFFDELYMCLCTLEHHANCFKFDHKPDLTGRDKTHCQNGAESFLDSQMCPLNILCICTDCYFGDQCQFYAKGIGLTLDDILRYQIRPNSTLTDQPFSVKVSATLTMVMFAAGLINSALSLMTFQSRDSRKVGCSMYLLASSITSLLTITMFTIKFWFLILTQINAFVSRSVLRGGCISIDPLLKLMLYTDNWLNACVALERAVTVFKGVNFNQSRSKQIARWIILFLPFFTMGTIIHEPLYRDLFDDKEEHRVWCVTNYSHSVQNYNTVILFFHFLVPFSCNLFSALFIISRAARYRVKTRTEQSYGQHLREQLNEHKQLVISPLIFVVLSLPRLIISLLSGCVKASHNPWLYLSGYFISFIPSIIVFAAFVLPSALYKKQFKESLNYWQRRFHRE